MPYSSLFADVDIPLVDVWNLYMERSRDFPDDHPILIDGDTNRSYTFAQIRDLSAAFGRGLRHTFDWQKGDVLAFFAPNHIDTAVVNLGVLWAGGVASPANPTYTAEELASQLVPGSNPRNRQLIRKRTLRIYHTGTMGLPKGVMLTHYNMVANACQFDKFDLKLLNWELDAQLGVLPFFHIYGLGVVLNVSLLSGAKCVVMAKFDLAQACQLIQDHRLTFVYVPPPIILALGKHPLVSQYDLSSLRFVNSAAAPLSRDLVDAVWDRLGVMVKQGYGLTETSPAVSVQMFDEWRRYLGSVGRLVPNMQAKVVDPEGKELPPNEVCLLLKGPNVFQGYWSRPELNKETFTEDGWFKTGDVMYIDTSGNLFITDRIKELIKYRFPSRTSRARSQAHRPAGVDGSEELAADIIEWLGSRVGPSKRLRGGVRFVKEIPKSPSGKILRRILRDQMNKEEGGPKAKL
ncbi:hypothetical protein LRP88_06747 [Fusarium phalaenopsidis]